MLSKLTKWFRAHLPHPLPRHRIGLPRLRGQIERLEARTVLSASIGSSAITFETGHAGSWESVFVQAGSPTGFSPFNATMATHWEDSPVSVAYQHNPQGRFEEVNGSWNATGPRALLIDQPFNAVVVVTVYLPTSGRWAPPRLGAGGVSTPIPKPIAATSPFPASQSEWPSEPPRTAKYRVDAVESYVPLLAIPSISPDIQTSTRTSNVRGRDSALQSNSTEELLLAAPFGEYHDAESDRVRVDDWWDNAEREEEFAGLHEFTLDGDEVSLDAFQQERTALDEVFAELSDLETPSEKPIEDAAEHRLLPNALDRRDMYIEAPWAMTAAVPSAHRDVVHGGMVLLEPGSDSNQSANDLTDIVAGSLANTNDVQFGVEASIGTYQAFDVGANEMRPSVNEPAPVAIPSAAARPSAASENVSAKRNGQPS